jgi:hypothetical protein
MIRQKKQMQNNSHVMKKIIPELKMTTLDALHYYSNTWRKAETIEMSV